MVSMGESTDDIRGTVYSPPEPNSHAMTAMSAGTAIPRSAAARRKPTVWGAESKTTPSGGALLVDRRPDAVLVSSDIQAIGLVSRLRRFGLAVPEDVALVSIDGTTAGEYSVPSLTSIAEPVVQMGATPVTHLIDNSRQILHLALDNHLIVRESCGCSFRRGESQ